MEAIRKANVSLQYRSKNETALLEVRMTFKDGEVWKSYYTRSKIEVAKSFWQAYRDNTNFRDVERVNLREEIETLSKELQEFISNRLITNRQPITSKWLKIAVDDYYTPPTIEVCSPTELIPFFDYFLQEKTASDNSKRASNVKTISNGTVKAYRVVRNKLERFQDDTETTYQMTDINISFLKEFQSWSLESGYSNSVVNKNVSQIKTLCRFAEDNDITIDSKIYNFSGSGKTLDEDIEATDIVTLSFSELNTLQSLKLEGRLDNVRDWLIISCYTGQRVSDFMRFKPSMIKQKSFGRVLTIKQQKTGKTVTIPLVRQVEDILQKREDKFPSKMTSQKYNDGVKEVCKLAGFREIIKGKITDNTTNGIRRVIGEYEKWELVSSHIGRRSFATNYYGILHTAKLKDITGHGTEAMLLKYIGEKSKEQQDEDSQKAYIAMISNPLA